MLTILHLVCLLPAPQPDWPSWHTQPVTEMMIIHAWEGRLCSDSLPPLPAAPSSTSAHFQCSLQCHSVLPEVLGQHKELWNFLPSLTPPSSFPYIPPPFLPPLCFPSFLLPPFSSLPYTPLLSPLSFPFPLSSSSLSLLPLLPLLQLTRTYRVAGLVSITVSPGRPTRLQLALKHPRDV